MHTLTETAFYSRTAIKYTVAFLIFLVLGRVVWIVGFNAFRYFFPKPPPPPTVSFGKLPELLFPSQENLPKFSYTLELPEGELPTTPPSLPVFTMPLPRSSLVALDETRRVATRLGFTVGEESISQSIYRFRRKDVPATLEANIITGAFSINYNLINDPTPFSGHPPTAEAAAAAIRSFLSSADLLPEDFTNGQISSQFLKLEGAALVTVPSLSEANFVRVDFFRQEYNELPVVTRSGTSGNVWFLVSGLTTRERQIIAGEYHYFPVDIGSSGTYPIKTAQTAWEEFNSGQGAIISPGNNKERVIIRRVYLSYYDNSEPQEFFQPVFVFEGDNDFVAYLSAVTSDYYGE